MKKFALFFSLCLAIYGAHAGIFKCTLDSGKIKYQDKPCRQAGKQDVFSSNKNRLQVRTPPSAGKKPASFSKYSLQGDWCEYAVAMKLDGKRDSSDKALWQFKPDGTIIYSSRVIRELKGKYKVTSDGINIDNKMIGSRKIVEFTSSTMTQKAFGYHFFRRGPC